MGRSRSLPRSSRSAQQSGSAHEPLLWNPAFRPFIISLLSSRLRYGLRVYLDSMSTKNLAEWLQSGPSDFNKESVEVGTLFLRNITTEVYKNIVVFHNFKISRFIKVSSLSASIIRASLFGLRTVTDRRWKVLEHRRHQSSLASTGHPRLLHYAVISSFRCCCFNQILRIIME